MMKIIPLLLFVLISISSSSQSVDALLSNAEDLQKKHEEKEALEVYQKVLEEDPDNLKALTEASFLSSRIGFRKDGDEKIKYYKQGKKYAKQALQVDSNSAEANYAMGLAMGRIAEISPTKEKIAASVDVKKYAERALRLDRSHAEAWHLLGKWHHGVEELGATKMFLIKTLYGGLPRASYESAVACYNKAINLKPDYILYYLDLAKTYIAMGREQDAKAVLEKVIKKQPQTPDDPKYLKESRELLENL